MVNLIICVTFFYALHLFLRMSFSLHKVPFVEFTYKGGDDSGLTELSERMMVATENLRQSMLIFIPFAMMSVVLNVDNLFTHTWSLNQAEEAYKIFDKQSDGKGVIIP